MEGMLGNLVRVLVVRAPDPRSLVRPSPALVMTVTAGSPEGMYGEHHVCSQRPIFIGHGGSEKGLSGSAPPNAL
jgi:hypothetical protein